MITLNRFGLSVIFLFLLAEYTLAALPPLTEEALKSSSDLIVTGTVTNIRTKDHREGEFVKTYHHIEIAIKEIEKGKISTNNNSVEAIGWVWKKTPSGWVGPSGIYRLDDLKPKSEVRVYLRGNEIVEPNGLSILTAEKKKP